MELFFIPSIGCHQIENTTVEENFKYGYRLGDMVRFNSEREADGGKYFHLKTFPDSIASEYMSRTNEYSNYKLLDEIVKERTTNNDQIPIPKQLLVHLRLGDVLDNTPYMVKDFLARHILHANGGEYVKPFSYYKSILQQMNALGLDAVILIGGYHIALASKSKSEKYVQKIKDFFESHGKSVQLRINGNADDDFIFFCNSTYFTPSGGGFSCLAREIVLMRGNHVIESND